MELTITPAAEKFIGRMIRFNGGSPIHGFRLVVSPGGCSGLSSEFTVEKDPHEGDTSVVIGAITLFLPLETKLLLDRGAIDFGETSVSAGLVFTTPNSLASSCSSSGSDHSHRPNQAVISIDTIKRRS